jgi:hypothetical protein
MKPSKPASDGPTMNKISSQLAQLSKVAINMIVMYNRTLILKQLYHFFPALATDTLVSP